MQSREWEIAVVQGVVEIGSHRGFEYGQIARELFGRAENDAREAEALGGLDVRGDIVNVQRAFCVDFQGFESGAIDKGIGFADANGVGIDAIRKEAVEVVSGLEMGNVDGVGVGKQAEAVSFGKVA